MSIALSNERNVQIVIAVLRAHGVHRVIASPGTTNIALVGSIQDDPSFTVYSAPDERSAAYMACGMAAQTGEPVVLSCTGATASRNYMPGLTEAYYRQLPVLAITSSHRNYDVGQLIDQVTDRTLLPRDVARRSVQIPAVVDGDSEWAATVRVNEAVLELFRDGGGPVHMNVETTYSRVFNVRELPACRIIQRYHAGEPLPVIPHGRIMVKIGAHEPFTPELTQAIDEFCRTRNAIVFCDQTSNYHGPYAVFGNALGVQREYASALRKPDLLIHLGSVASTEFRLAPRQSWRVNPDGEIRDLYRTLTAVFQMDELAFFKAYAEDGDGCPHRYLDQCLTEERAIANALASMGNRLPFSNVALAHRLAPKLPQNAILHLAIRHSLRSWNLFRTPSSVTGFSDVGGFGIDGCLSAALGAALAAPHNVVYSVVGDLAFFYDMNVLGNRHLGPNMRILLVNNSRGFEMEFQGNPGLMFGDAVGDFMSARGHYQAIPSTRELSPAGAWAESLGFEYHRVESMGEFATIEERFLSPRLDRPMLVEAITSEQAENEAFGTVATILSDPKTKIAYLGKEALRGTLGEAALSKVKGVLKSR